MKKIILCVLTLSTAFQFSSCKKEEKKKVEKVAPVVKKEPSFSLQDAKSNIYWTAYKTTKKVPVRGKFTSVDITAGGVGKSIKEAVNNAEFAVPVSSLFTKNDARDFKIQKFFFSMMKNTKLLSGKLVLEDDTKGYADITMNGVTHKMPFTYVINGKQFKMEGVLDLKDWKAGAALASLNDACKDLHQGEDGVSKTWSDVAINISTLF
ncbi:Probable lipoprotein precursor [Tenacibaculum maritimum]|uniref:YceI family protein n=1 Tax=Tenacibaculum maritimum TaxID=107401 RepID=UPI0012E4F754|nr:YceI family protein [Tenacibaculum maritimum]CAA0149255.1 Probable lipoprotein precursor [Tenacibaculum maritimum]